MKGEEPWPDLVIATEANNQIDVLSVDQTHLHIYLTFNVHNTWSMNSVIIRNEIHRSLQQTRHSPNESGWMVRKKKLNTEEIHQAKCARWNPTERTLKTLVMVNHGESSGQIIIFHQPRCFCWNNEISWNLSYLLEENRSCEVAILFDQNRIAGINRKNTSSCQCKVGITSNHSAIFATNFDPKLGPPKFTIA